MDFIKKKAYGQITISNVVDGQNGQSAINIVLGNESQNIPCTNNGTISEQLLIDISFSGYLGTKKVPASAVVGLLPSGVTLATNTNSTSTKDGLIQLNIAKGSNLGGNNIINGKINITFTVEKQQVIKDFTWCKTKDGAEGSMIIYELISSTPVLNKEFNNSIKPNTITFQSFFRKSNNTTKNPYNGMFIIKESTNGGATYTAKYTSAINENSKTYTLSSNTVTHLQCILCEANKISNQLDVVTVPVLSDESIKNEISKVVSTISGVSTKVDAVDKKIIDKIWQTDITTQINNYDGNTVKNIRDQITEQTKEIGKVTTKVSDVESTFSNGLSSLTERVAKNEQDANGFKQTVEKNYATKNELGETSSTIRSEMSQTAETIDQKVSSLDGAVSQHTQTLSTVTTELKSAQDDISKVTQTANEVLNEVKNARGDKASLKLKIDSIATEVSNNKGKISKVEQKADTISQRVENVNTNLSSQITQTSNEIRQEVANADKGLASQITQTAETINQRITNEKQGLESQIAQSSQDVLIQVSNKHYDKATVDSMLKVESDKITSTVTSKINVGSRNLLLKSDTVYTNSLYEIATYQMVEKMKSGTKYTCTIWGNLASGKTDFSISLNGNIPLGTLKKEENVYSLTFDGIQDNSESSVLYVYANPSSYQNTSTINKIKLSYGNTRTDWSPAVEEKLSTEDFNEIINGDNGIIDQIENSKSEITQLSNSISTLVTDENGSSLMTQTPDGWQFNIGGINKKLDDAKKDIANNKSSIENTDKYVDIIQKQQEAIEAKTAVINFTSLNGQPAILLGQTNNSFKLRITNTSIDFLDGSTVVAYISNKVLYIEKAIIKNEIQIGEGAGFVFKRRSNGNMGIRFVKGVIV